MNAGGLALKAGQTEVSFRVSGTPDEQLLKWLTAEEDRVLRGHLCHEGCSNSPQSDDLIHVKKLRLLEFEMPPWAHNLKEAAEAEVLRKLAAESDKRAREAKGKGIGAPAEEAARGAETSTGSSSSDSSKEKKNKKKKDRKKKKKSKAWKVEGKKDLKQLFQYTGECGRRTIRGVSQDQEGSSQGARCLILPDYTKHVKVSLDCPRPASCPSRWSSTRHMSPIPPPSSSRAIVTAVGSGEPEHLLSSGRHPRGPSSTGSRHPAPTTQVSGVIGRRILLGLSPKTGTDSCGIVATGGPRRKQIRQSGVEGGVEEQAGQSTHLDKQQRRGQECGQDKERRDERQRKEGERGQRQEGPRTGEGQVRSPLGTMPEAFIEAELQRIDHEVNDGKEGALRKMPDRYLDEENYDHPDATILVGTVQDGRAGPDSNPHDPELIEPEKAELAGLRFVDVVEGLEGELSRFLRKTTTPGEVFPLPIDIALNQPSFAHLTRDVRTVLRGFVRSLNDVYDRKPHRDQTVSPLHVRILRLLSEEVGRFLDKLPPLENLSWKEFLKVRSIDYKGEEVKTAQQTSWDNIAPALPDEVGTVDLEQVVESGCLHYVQHFEEFLLPKEAQAQVYTKPPKVMVPMDQWETFCAGLLSRGICGIIPNAQFTRSTTNHCSTGSLG